MWRLTIREAQRGCVIMARTRISVQGPLSISRLATPEKSPVSAARGAGTKLILSFDPHHVRADDSQLPHAELKSGAVDSQSCSRAVRSGDHPVGLFQCRSDMLAL